MRSDTKLDRRSRNNARVTITDLSQALCLTKGTVSRALNGYPDISEATRLRVVRAAQAMGYRPLTHAQAIKTGRSRSIGFVVELSQKDAHRPFLAEFLAGLTQAASYEGWTLTVATSETEADTLKIMRSLVQQQKADGFILPRVLWQDPRIALLSAEKIPFICYGRPKNYENLSYFDIESELSMREAVQHFVDLGHQQIAYIGSATHYAFSHHRRDGYLRGMNEAGLVPDPFLIKEGVVSAEDAAEATRGLLALDEPPTAVLCATDTLARGVYEVANQIGLKIGSEISVIGYDGSPEASAMWPHLSTFSIDNRKAGVALGTMFIDRIREPDAPVVQTLLQSHLCRAGSTGAPVLSPEQLAHRLAPFQGQLIHSHQNSGRER
ncbi:LacI family DNA-binding transcriptional regulator [Celeribacter litoreus]|uniref:LacI family DNA-binding transcriptional regulator n=1 Tax=Celeribacter litoreus TaxID=2876714 RepID=UPI001CCE94C9|nr:LacI family DNA-binding transcriptional regulator [Celeribacter litoreus]MCA0044446.1 LacI family transcriptional regulator [Celeribacter litoreus]